ncbi:uncharacterized protein LOC126902204 isoform X1 [Daktulosphaira vitifoliae]|uniref:uncharacterized protein LOC126902204 isoform X1 n=1 Tax=Daktulosphaira vitifoliae TaxID=58002 RepID=UPI0021AAB041|nr:uncharacterized protein LOC126902204 isoform X1 [Daktulosphaira vitifoliae]
MEVIPLIRSSNTGSETSNGGNDIKRRVQEWSRLDRLTGILEHARVEADQWTNHTANTKHKFGKVTNTRARNLADGSKEQTKQTKQLEVFQSHTDGCSVQVIRSHTSTTSSWHNSNTISGLPQWSSIFDKKEPQFDQFNLEFSPLDVSSQKNKASIGRSGSISSRRPPTRRPQTVRSNSPIIELVDSTDNDETSNNHQEQNSDSNSTNLNRYKSCSTDEIHSETTESDDHHLDRSSRFRRSLQLSQSKNVQESSHKVVGELEDVLKKVLGKKLHVINREESTDDEQLIKPLSALKKPAFITVESLTETKNNLKHYDDQSKDDDGIEPDVKPVANIRSLDYRGSTLNRNEEWYNRRKSYGFEKMASDQNDKYTTDLSAIDSSTDSGICRSTENGLSSSSRQSSTDRECIADLVKKYSNKEINNNNSQVNPYSTTLVTKGRILEAINSLRTKSNTCFDNVKFGENISVNLKENDKQQIFGRRLSVDADQILEKEEVPKRHSIAVVSEVIDKVQNVDKKVASKKVEFCRTEVHFDTTPGKINIVDMEDKPAPAQIYRPKKKYNRPPDKNNGLPEYHFGVTPNDIVLIEQNKSSTDEDDNKPKSILKPQQQNVKEENLGIASDNGIEVRISSTESTPVDYRRASWSVADRVKQVEAIGFSTRVNFTEGETTAVGFDPADPKKYHRYSYNETKSPVWNQNNSNAADNAVKCHEKLLVRIGTSGAQTHSIESTSGKVNDCTLASTSLVMNTPFRSEQPSTYTEEINIKMQSRIQKASSTSWPRSNHKHFSALAFRKFNILKSCTVIKHDQASESMPEVLVALDDLSKTIDQQIVDSSTNKHVMLIKVRQPRDEIRGRLEYAKDLMSTDETSEESLKADEEVRSYMAADCNENEQDCSPYSHTCDNLKKLISTIEQNNDLLFCNQDGFIKQSEDKLSPVTNVSSVLLNHEQQLTSNEQSKFQPVKIHTVPMTVLDENFVAIPQKTSKKVPVKIVQDNRKEKSKLTVPAIKKCTPSVSLKQVPMTIQPKIASQEREKKFDKKETTTSVIGPRVGSIRIRDKTSQSRNQDLFSTGRDSWCNMPKDLGPKLNKSKVTTYKQRNCKDIVESVEVSVLEELNRAADEILKAVNGYTDDESQMHSNFDDKKKKPDDAKLKNKKRAARLLQRANSREALLHLDEISSSEDEVIEETQRTKPRTQRKNKSQQTNNSVATKTTTSFTKKIQNRTQTNNTLKSNNVQHKVHPTYYGNVSNSSTQTTRYRTKTSDIKQSIDQKENKPKYQSKITTRVFNSKKPKNPIEETRNRIKGS